MSTLYNIKTIAKREILDYFVSPVAYIFIVIFLVLNGFFTFMVGQFFEISQANLSPFFQWHPWLYLFLVPAIGMHVWSEERKSGTVELLFTMPVTISQCIIGKFIASWLFLGLALFCTFPIIITVGYLGSPDYGVILCGYIGSFLLAGSYLAITTMTSALTRNQVVSFILSVVICLVIIMAGWPPVTRMLVTWAPFWLVDTVSSFSVMPHFEALQRGIIDSRDIIYYLSLIFFSLFSCGVILKNHQAG